MLFRRKTIRAQVSLLNPNKTQAKSAIKRGFCIDFFFSEIINSEKNLQKTKALTAKHHKFLENSVLFQLRE